MLQLQPHFPPEHNQTDLGCYKEVVSLISSRKNLGQLQTRSSKAVEQEMIPL